MRPEFLRVVQELCLFFGREEPPAARVAAWYEVVRRLPGGDFPGRALDLIKAEEPHFPANPARALLLAYERLEGAAPAGRDPGQAPADCPACGNTGSLVAERDGQRAFFRCGHCGRTDAAGLPPATVPALARAGYRLLTGRGAAK